MEAFMSRGKRYEGEQKLNLKKVFAVIIAIAVIIMFFIGISKLFNTESSTEEKTVSMGYYPVYTDEKWGVINTKGDIVIEPQYDEYIVVPDSSQAIFLCTTDVNYEEGTYSTKAINEKNEELFTDYEKVEAIENYDNSNNLWYASGILKVSKDGKWGVIDTKGNVIVDCKYDDITALKGVENSLLTEVDGKYGIIDYVGSVIIENEYESIEPLANTYENGYIVENADGKYGVITYTKTNVVAEEYDDIKNVYGNGNYYIVKEGDNWEIIDTDAKKYLEGEYDDIIDINGENAIVSNGNKLGVVAIADGKNIIDIDYDIITHASGDNYIVSRDSKYGIIDSNGNMLLEPSYTNIVYRDTAGFYEASTENGTSDLLDSDLNVKLSNVIISELNTSNGYVKVRQNGEYKYYNFRFEEKANMDILSGNTIFLSRNEEGMYGFVDRNGNVVTDYIYEDATEQNAFGYASVKKDGLWGAINSRGQIAVAPAYELDNNILVEFIGKWHLGEDLNLYYFTDE